MGDSSVPYDGNTTERPVHAIYVDTFYMDRTEVTNQQYADALNWARSQANLITIRTLRPLIPAALGMLPAGTAVFVGWLLIYGRGAGSVFRPSPGAEDLEHR